MRRVILSSILSLLLSVSFAYATPSNSITVPNPAVANDVISSSYYNANNNEIQTKYNSHTHTDITQLGTITSGVWAGTAINYSFLEMTDSIVGDDLSDNAMSKIYPIGSVYISVVDTNPATLFGFGTWVRIAEGQMLIGQKSTDTDFDTPEETGGAKTHTMTVDEMPAHSHVEKGELATNLAGGNYVITSNGTSNQNTVSSTAETGGGQAHSILNPYCTVFIWKRTL